MIDWCSVGFLVELQRKWECNTFVVLNRGKVPLLLVCEPNLDALILKLINNLVFGLCVYRSPNKFLYLVKRGLVRERMAVFVCTALCFIQTELEQPFILAYSLQSVLTFGCAVYLFHCRYDFVEAKI